MQFDVNDLCQIASDHTMWEIASSLILSYKVMSKGWGKEYGKPLSTDVIVLKFEILLIPLIISGISRISGSGPPNRLHKLPEMCFEFPINWNGNFRV